MGIALVLAPPLPALVASPLAHDPASTGSP